jgi:CheY-like chemotaxis protein
VSLNQRPSASRSSGLILFGEDDIDDEEFLKEVFLLLENSYDLRFVNKGHHLITLLEDTPDNELPCLLVLDYNMPGLNGAEILSELKLSPRYVDIPKIIWSTSGSDVYKNNCLQLGANDYLIKPSSVNGLLEVVRYMVSYCRTKK